jgi:long-chain acyl-CoA synthetase
MAIDSERVGLRRHAERFPDKLALAIGDARCTYGELNARVNRLARALRRIGVGPGDTVAAVLHNDVGWLELLNALGKIGGLLVPVGYRLRAPEIAYMLEDSAAAAIVVDSQLAGEIDRALAGRAWRDDRLWVTGGGEIARGLGYEAVLADESADEPEGSYVGGGHNVLIYTSGTTGRPRAVDRRMDPRTVHLGSLSVAQMWNLDEREIHLAAAPMYHTGPGAYAQLHLLIGGTAVVMRQFEPRESLALIEQFRATNAFMVPTHFARIMQLDRKVRESYRLESIRLLMHSAAPCPVHVKRGIMALFPPGTVTEFYGSSESGFTRITAQEWLRKPGSVGRPWPGHEIRILDDYGNPCAAGDVGLIYVRGPRMEFSYRTPNEDGPAPFRDGFFTAGDLGYLDDEGYLFIADRRTDLIISGGANVYPAEVENVLAAHPAVADVAVLGVPHDELGKSVLAVVEGRVGSVVDADEIIAYARENLARYKCPTRVEIVDRLPRESNGKIRKRELLARYWPHQI